MHSKDNLQKELDKKMIVRVIIEKGDSDKREYFFKETFRIGRDDNCAIKINDGLVSREHIEISLKKGEWWIADLFSSNGTFLDGKRIDHRLLSEPINLELGKDGPIIRLELISETDAIKVTHSGVQGSLTSYIQRYFKVEADNPNIGDHTRMIQQAFQVVKKKQSKKYYKIIVGILIIAVAAAVYSIYKHIQQNEYKVEAANMFYKIKDLELKIESLIDSLDRDNELRMQFREQRKQAELEYDKLVESLGLYSTDEKERLIQKMARQFGECEINMPQEFISEVKKYIGYWNVTSRYRESIQRAKENNYPKYIVEQLYKRNLAPQFFYLPLQESDFKEKSVGIPTYMGYAKGIWHFIPSTAEQYGLKVGPLKDTNEYDPLDERFDFLKATEAATNYLKYIYRTDAQASGLLVMASYNWGEPRVIKYIRQLTPNPKERNFWKLLSTYQDKVPKQTYDYVFYIFSAAVIGENPKLFGFNFDNPLAAAIEDLEIN